MRSFCLDFQKITSPLRFLLLKFVRGFLHEFHKELVSHSGVYPTNAPEIPPGVLLFFSKFLRVSDFYFWTSLRNFSWNSTWGFPKVLLRTSHFFSGSNRSSIRDSSRICFWHSSPFDIHPTISPGISSEFFVGIYAVLQLFPLEFIHGFVFG